MKKNGALAMPDKSLASDDKSNKTSASRESAAGRLARVRRVFLDMDGTIYHGGTVFPTTVPFLDFLTRRGVGYTFLTNNSSHTTAEYRQRFARLGIPADGDVFYTSTDYALAYLREKHPDFRRLHFFGMPAVRAEVEAAGFETVDDDPQAVLTAFHRDFHYRELCRAAYWLRRGAPGFATHPDVFCPTDEATWLVDCGAITRCLEASTGARLTVLGKPDPGLLRMAAARYGLDTSEVLMAGDRLSTDIALGNNAGALTCHIRSEGADIAIPQGVKPDFSVAHLGELQALWNS